MHKMEILKEKLDETDEKMLPVHNENVYDFIEPLGLSRDEDDQLENLVPRNRNKGLSINYPCKLNIKLLLYIGGIITFLVAFIGMVVSLYEVQNVALLKEELSIATQKISSLEKQLFSTVQNVSALEQDLFNMSQNMSFFNNELMDAAQKISVIEQDLFNTSQNMSYFNHELMDTAQKVYVLKQNLLNLSQNMSFFDIKLMDTAQKMSVLEINLYNTSQNMSFLNRELLNTAQKASVLEQDLFNTVQKVSSLEVAVFNSCLGSAPDLPATSCQQILDCNPSASSGHYWIGTYDNVALKFCDMQRTCGGITGGWLRLISLNMTKFGSTCPTGLTLRQYSNKNFCGKPQGYSSAGCGNVIFNTIGEYSKVCGKIIGYQYGSTDSFRAGQNSIDEIYLDGVSLTHGSPRQHIWSFAAALDEAGTYPQSNCPCISGTSATPPPTFVGSDYFCDTGTYYYSRDDLYPDDPLWDGQGCGTAGVTCCSMNNPPWFFKQLSATTDNSIEMRVCTDGYYSGGYEDVLIEQLEIYVQ